MTDPNIPADPVGALVPHTITAPSRVRQPARWLAKPLW